MCRSAVAQWLSCCATNRKVVGSIPGGVSGFFIDIKSFGSHYGSASNRNEYQEYFLGVKAGLVRKADNLQPSCAVVTKSRNLYFLEPSGPVQDCFITFYMCRSNNDHLQATNIKSRSKVRYSTWQLHSPYGISRLHNF